MSCICGQAPSYCQQCIDKGYVTQYPVADNRIKHHQSLKTTLQAQVADVTTRCERHVSRQKPWRELRAEVAGLERRIDERRARLAEVERRIKAHQPEPTHRTLPTSDGLVAAKNEIAHIKRQRRAVDSRIIAARQVLVKEAAAVMGLKRWEIAGLALPPVKEIRCMLKTHLCGSVADIQCISLH
jgi:ferritin-like metal-binding protein YciE